MLDIRYIAKRFESQYERFNVVINSDVAKKRGFRPFKITKNFKSYCLSLGPSINSNTGGFPPEAASTQRYSASRYERERLSL